MQIAKAGLYSKMADAFSPLVSDACIVGFVVVCIFKDEGARSVDWFKKLWMIHHLLLPHPQKRLVLKNHPTLTFRDGNILWNYSSNISILCRGTETVLFDIFHIHPKMEIVGNLF